MDIAAFWGGQIDHLSDILSDPNAFPKHQLGDLEQKWGFYRLAIQAGISSISASSDAATVDAVGASDTKGTKPDWTSKFLQSIFDIFRSR